MMPGGSRSLPSRGPRNPSQPEQVKGRASAQAQGSGSLSRLWEAALLAVQALALLAAQVLALVALLPGALPVAVLPLVALEVQLHPLAHGLPWPL